MVVYVARAITCEEATMTRAHTIIMSQAGAHESIECAELFILRAVHCLGLADSPDAKRQSSRLWLHKVGSRVSTAIARCISAGQPTWERSKILQRS